MAPAGWVTLPVRGGVDLERWARDRTAGDAASRGLTPSPRELDRAAALLGAGAERAVVLWTMEAPVACLSFALRPDPLGPVLAVLDAALFPFEDTPISVERMTVLHGPAVDKVEEAVVATRLGTGISYRGLFTSDIFEAFDDAASFSLVEAVTLTVLPPGLDGYLWVDAQWSDLTRGDDIARQVLQVVDLMRLDGTHEAEAGIEG